MRGGKIIPDRLRTIQVRLLLPVDIFGLISLNHDVGIVENFDLKRQSLANFLLRNIFLRQILTFLFFYPVFKQTRMFYFLGKNEKITFQNLIHLIAKSRKRFSFKTSQYRMRKTK